MMERGRRGIGENQLEVRYWQFALFFNPMMQASNKSFSNGMGVKIRTNIHNI